MATSQCCEYKFQGSAFVYWLRQVANVSSQYSLFTLNFLGYHTQYIITRSFHPVLRQKSFDHKPFKMSTRIISSVSICSYCFVDGLMYRGIGKCRQIPVQTEEFVKIWNSKGNHWIIIYAVNFAPCELQVYDGLYRTVSKEIKELVDTHIYDRTAIHQAPRW